MWFLEGFLGGGNDGIFCCTACIVWFKRTTKTNAKSWRRIYTSKAICGYGPPSVWTESERRTKKVIKSEDSEANDEGGTAPPDTSLSAGVTAPQVEGGGATVTRHVPAPEPSSETQPPGAGTQPNLPPGAGTQQPDTQEQSPGATPEAPHAAPEAPGATPSEPGETPAEPVDASAAVATVTTGPRGTSAAVATATTRPPRKRQRLDTSTPSAPGETPSDASAAVATATTRLASVLPIHNPIATDNPYLEQTISETAGISSQLFGMRHDQHQLRISMNSVIAEVNSMWHMVQNANTTLYTVLSILQRMQSRQ